MRMKVHYQVSLSNTSATAGEGLLLDLSAEGCRMECTDPPSVNTYLSLRIVVSSTEAPILVDLAAVRWSCEKKCGIHFLSIRPPQAERLHKFLAARRPPTSDEP
ncbi:MAG: hypothetical protein OJF52_001348 [Nitrospira sp.]|jgi:hypothetical protein|nr:MAG: hypothetical protein OJF52_001348 [Nitrospira sp.]